MLKRTIAGLLAAVLCALLAAPAWSQVSVNIGIGVPVAPPLPRVEVIPAAPHPGYVWAPGYWAWHDGRHIWVRGRHIAPRPGYAWVSEHWEQRGPSHYFVQGQWVAERGRGRDHNRDMGRGRHRE